MNNIIQSRELGKKYTLRHQKQERYNALRDVIADSVKKWSRKLLHSQLSYQEADSTHEDFWALKDISFEINKGDRVGIIGRNGAGKSTLLKILSRITEPTEGRVSIHGRVASLLEVGTGFHPELTGRENVYLNGAILGMSKVDIKKKFDEIVAFAEVEKFLDTPVKRYSSGMYVRLAFAVAAHLEPEILVVDEVLAVGDAQFQKKCLGKLGEVGKDGRTVLFVSHNMAAISALCERVLLLDNGKIRFDGEVKVGIDLYLDAADSEKGFADLVNKKSSLWKQPKAFSKLVSIETLDEAGKRQSIFKMGGRLHIQIGFEIIEDRKDVEVGIFIRDNRETILGLLSSAAEGYRNFARGYNHFQIEISELTLMPGEYNLGIWIVSQRQVDDACESALAIDIISDSFTNNFVDYDRFKGYGSLIRSSWNNTA